MFSYVRLLLLRLFFELRMCISWAWSLPLVGIIALLGGMYISKTLLSDYPFVMREALELGLPLVGIFLFIPLLEREWMQGTLTQVALCKSLFAFLLLRIFLVLLYLLVLTLIATIISIVGTNTDNTIQWIAGVLLTVGCSIVALAAIALLITHVTVSGTSGYIVSASIWIVNLGMNTILLTMGGNPTFFSFGLFSWTFSMYSGFSGWWIAKVCLFALSILLLIIEIPLLHHEVRLLNYINE